MPQDWSSELDGKVHQDQRATFQEENAEETFTSDQSVQENAPIYSQQLQKNIPMPAGNGQVDFIVALVFLLLHYEGWSANAKTCWALLLWT